MNATKQIIIEVPSSDLDRAVREFITRTYPELSQGYDIRPSRLDAIQVIAHGGAWTPTPATEPVCEAAAPTATATITKRSVNVPAFRVRGKGLEVRPRTTIKADNRILKFPNGQQLDLPKLQAGADYQFHVSYKGKLAAILVDNSMPPGTIGGFHVDLGGKILENSIWDASFRPACPDPRGMALVSDPAGKPLFWVDIYLMDQDGRSRAGAVPADGYEKTPTGFDKLRQADAIELLARHGKQLLTRKEFALAADGVKEGKATGSKPTKTERVDGLTSRFGLEQATGALWVWSSEKDNDGWPYIMGGDWYGAGSAGPRRVNYLHPVYSNYLVGARGRCDHLKPV